MARELGIVLCVGTYERGPERGIVYNASVLIDTDGSLLGVYRKTHPFCTEAVSGGGWVTPGDTVTVCDTALGRIGMIICFDGDYPELSRIQAVQGAEVICRPSALLRSADIWELTSRARAYDNHVFVIGANATGIDPAGVIYFGNSHIVTPNATIVAKAASHEGWVSARLDPETALASLTPGLQHPARASTTCATATSTSSAATARSSSRRPRRRSRTAAPAPTTCPRATDRTAPPSSGPDDPCARCAERSCAHAPGRRICTLRSDRATLAARGTLATARRTRCRTGRPRSRPRGRGWRVVRRLPRSVGRD